LSAIKLVPQEASGAAGMNADWMTNGIDLDGKMRIRYGFVDMGAFEMIKSASIYRFY